ncbi:MAG: hypothetical protein D6706_04175 [Chloroflexi bacterium]|nr:MAG: hypothetical protein D6706_04175 [Chloroflexota bacterium]
MSEVTPITEARREAFLAFIERVLEKETAVKGVVGIGSIATGHMHPGSDIDAVIFLDPLDYHIVPAEAIWLPDTDKFYSIFDDSLRQQGLPLDFLRLSWQKWSDPEFEWPEERRAELAMGWIAYDPHGEVARLIAQRTAYPDELRLKRLDEAIVWLDQHLGKDVPESVWQNLGPAIAFDRLEAAYHYLVQALFAYNRKWQVWRNREMSALLRLPWLPQNFSERVLVAANAPSLDHEGYQARVKMLRELFQELLEQLIADGVYSQMPVDQAFIRLYDEPGRAWNIDDWNKMRLVRRMSIEGLDEMTL